MTDTKQPNALWLAEQLELHIADEPNINLALLHESMAATELRRLHEVNAELLEALKQTMFWIDNWSPEFTYDPDWSNHEDKAKAAIAKAEGESK